MLKPNDFGKYKKEDVLKNGFEIVTYGMTASEIEKYYNIKIPKELRQELSIGFMCRSEWRGCSPVFDIQKILQLKQEGKL